MNLVAFKNIYKKKKKKKMIACLQKNLDSSYI